MSSRRYEEERLLIQDCLAGNKEALATLQRDYLEPLRSMLAQRGATSTQADDVVSDLWTDCVVGHDGRPPLLNKYQGRASLKTWLFRVGVNMYVDSLRDTSREVQLANYRAGESVFDCLHEAALPLSDPESALVALLRQSLQAAFDRCPAEDLLRLRLMFLHGLTQREIARMWGCHETTMARELRRALQLLADQTMEYVRKSDPRLQLTWEDFLVLCDTERLDFL